MIPCGNIPEIDHYELDGIPLYHIPGSGSTILTLASGSVARTSPSSTVG